MASTLVESKNVSATRTQLSEGETEETVKATTVTTAEAEADDVFTEIEKLQDEGINVADISKLKGAGFCTSLSVLQATRKELSALKGFTEAKVEKVIEAATKIENKGILFMTGSLLLQKRANVVRITTGSCQLDRILNGGIESMALTEIFGENRCGKTQLCHTLCVTAQLPLEMMGGNGKVCFIDTEGTFRPEKIAAISQRYNLNPDAVLDNIMYARAHTHEHLQQLICMAAAKMVEEAFSLLVIDSIMALFRVEFSGRGELADRQQCLGRLLSRLQKMSEQFNIAILYTNHVMSDPSGAMTMIANPSKPIGGHVLGHASTHRLSLRLGRGDQRICKIFDSPNLPAADAVFQLSDQGVTDPND